LQKIIQVVRDAVNVPQFLYALPESVNFFTVVVREKESPSPTAHAIIPINETVVDYRQLIQLVYVIPLIWYVLVIADVMTIQCV
jgi:hypothetical protein